MNADKLYRDAVKTLKPNKARMGALHAASAALHNEAVEAVKAHMKATGCSATELYRKACANRRDDETALAKEVRVVLLGLARKEW